MIIRIWSAVIAHERKGEYVEFAKSRSLPMFMEQRGCLGVLFVNKHDDIHSVFSFWKTRDDADALQASSTYLNTSAALNQTGCIKEVLGLEVHELEGGFLRYADLEAALGTADSVSPRI